jgi:hypothetical protein
MLDVYKFPVDFVRALSKDMSEEDVRMRFSGNQ